MGLKVDTEPVVGDTDQEPAHEVQQQQNLCGQSQKGPRSPDQFDKTALECDGSSSDG